jgi:hypothetical protein
MEIIMDDKLHRFIMGALTNPRHPAYQFQQTPILRHYAVNVKGCGLLEAMTPEMWEKDVPVYADKMKQVMALCEADEAAITPTETPSALPAPDEIGTLKAQLTDLTAKVAALENKPEAETEKKPDEKPAE